SVDENTAIGSVVYTAASDDSADISGGVTYALKAGSDAALTIDATSGEVTLLASPDHETATSHVFTVVATDAAGNVSEKEVTLSVNDLDEIAPTITSADTVTNVNENIATGTVVYTATSDDSADISGGVTYSLKAGSDAALSINATSGEVTLVASPDHEKATSHAFTVVATDAAGNSSEKSLVLNINDLDEVAPTITSAKTVAAVDENTAIGTVIYTATSDDSADISGGVTYSLKAGSDAALNIDATTGEVTLLASPDHETATSHAFTVVATDAAGNSTEQALTLAINDLDEVAPTITSAASGSVDENTAIGSVVYTAASDDSADISGGVTYALKAGSDAALTIDATSG
ncbi:MAG TPA: cadherin repeat domain-containing protein, partial [Rheinheimera sp.]|nr:cadherin repeat domain-containing protein [Rheinheimera sp.]